ncbi:MAG TPA: tetratricopeptide repeat protein [Myxococcales bacterium]|nr:tetratricopeptide repeat protein [Myxococcales bacterium]
MRRAAWAVLAVACAHAPAPVRPEAAAEAPAEVHVSARAYRHYLDALLARNEDDLASAASELRDALLYDPGSPHLHTVLAEVLLAQGHVGDAEEVLRAAVGLDPQHAPALVLLGRIAEAREKPDEARGRFREALASDPDNADAHRGLLRVELTVGNLAAAQEAASSLSRLSTQALARARQDDEADLSAGEAHVVAERLREAAAGGWLDIARALVQRHDEAGAGNAFAEARAVLPSDADVLAAEASWLESRGRVEPARALYLRLLAQRPDSPEVLSALARLALLDGDLPTLDAHTRKLLDLAANLSPWDGASREQDDDRSEVAGALLKLAIPLLGARRSADAQAALQAALRLYPEHPELSFYRALALVQRGRPLQGALGFEAVEKSLAARTGPFTPALLGGDPEALALDAQVQAALARGRAGEAHESMRRVRALFLAHPADEGVALAVLEAFDRSGRAADALDLLAAAARAHPESDGLLYALGNAQDRAGLRRQALATMRKVLSLQPQHSGALNYVGYSLAERGSPADLREAETLLARAVELRPDDGAIADSWGYCLLKLGRASQALAELHRADRLNPGDPVILGHLGDALVAAGRKEEALAAFRSALSRLLPPPRARPAASSHALLDPPDRSPDPEDGRVRAEIEQKLKALAP